jgi:hypothetical protein
MNNSMQNLPFLEWVQQGITCSFWGPWRSSYPMIMPDQLWCACWGHHWQSTWDSFFLNLKTTQRSPKNHIQSDPCKYVCLIGRTTAQMYQSHSGIALGKQSALMLCTEADCQEWQNRSQVHVTSCNLWPVLDIHKEGRKASLGKGVDRLGREKAQLR